MIKQYKLNSQRIIRLNPPKEFPVIGIKITEEAYVEDFVKKGIIHFSNPQIWRDRSRCGGKQLDEDEGCFCFSTMENDELLALQGRKFVKYRTSNGWKYYEDNDLIVGICIYGILMSRFRDSFMRYGVKEIRTKDVVVPTEFFRDFVEGVECSNRKAIIIFDLPRFCEMVIDTIKKKGVSKEEIFVSPVFYVNKKTPYCIKKDFPFEYFLKDDAYSKQSELRIMIASRNKEFYKQLERNNYNISIGDITSFAVIQDNYNKDLFLSIQGNKLIYELASPITMTMDDRSFAQLIRELYQIKQNQLPGDAKRQEELDGLAKPIINHIKRKYGVEFRDDWRLYNVPNDLYNTLPDLYKGLCVRKREGMNRRQLMQD